MAHVGIDAREYGTAQWSGIGRYVAELLRGIGQTATPHRFTIFLPQTAIASVQALFPATAPVTLQPVSPSYYSWREQLLLPIPLLRARVDLLHFPHFNIPLLYRRPFVATIHDVIPLFYPGYRARAGRIAAYRFLMRRVTARAASLIAVSQYTARDLAQHFAVPPSRVRVIREAVDTRHFAPVPDSAARRAALERYGIRRPFLLYVGVWRYHKNLVRLLQAFEAVVPTLTTPYQLVFAGRPDPRYPLVQEAIARSPLRDRIVTPGFIRERDLPAVFSAADLFVFPSLAEGVGLPPLEALACGTVVAASQIDALTETLQEAAVFFDPTDVGSIGAALRRGLTDSALRAQLRERGQILTRARTWSDVVSETLATYDATLASL